MQPQQLESLQDKLNKRLARRHKKPTKYEPIPMGPAVSKDVRDYYNFKLEKIPKRVMKKRRVNAHTTYK